MYLHRDIDGNVVGVTRHPIEGAGEHVPDDDGDVIAYKATGANRAFLREQRRAAVQALEDEAFAKAAADPESAPQAVKDYLDIIGAAEAVSADIK